MKDPMKLKELFIEKIDLADVMLSYGVVFQYNPKLASEVQYRCPIHGKDSKPSARLYNSTKSCYCWVCHKSWDVVSFIQDMEKLPFLATLKEIENRYHIDTSSISNKPEMEFEAPEVSDLRVTMNHVKNGILDLRKRIEFEKYRALCTAFVMLDYANSRGVDIEESLNKIQDKILCQKRSLLTN